MFVRLSHCERHNWNLRTFDHKAVAAVLGSAYILRLYLMIQAHDPRQQNMDTFLIYSSFLIYYGI